MAKTFCSYMYKLSILCKLDKASWTYSSNPNISQVQSRSRALIIPVIKPITAWY